MRRRNHIARDLGSPKYRQRVIKGKRRNMDPFQYELDFADWEDEDYDPYDFSWGDYSEYEDDEY